MAINREAIHVARPSLPPLRELMPYLEQIWESRTLTNGGPFHRQLEQALCEYLGVEHISLFNNGTIALITALQSLQLSGEVITTPYSFVATSHALLWNSLTPVFVDIDAETFNLDPVRIEAAITSETTAILAVHCYGRPCRVAEIQEVADAHGLRVIYDAAHAFGVECKCGSVLNHGDLAVLSFHATKVFNTFEGGAIVCRDEEMKTRIDQLKNFGISSETEVVAAGINGKMNELSAAVGLLQLKYVDEDLRSRKEVDEAYRFRLRGIDGIRCVASSGERRSNYAYFPILVEDDYVLTRDELWQLLKESGILARRYFFPLISDFPTYRCLPSANPANLPVASKLSREVLCLPIYPSLESSVVDELANIISRG
jgi:dTDP-4-amino-4,6-dideoxygalactose transaminase